MRSLALIVSASLVFCLLAESPQAAVQKQHKTTILGTVFEVDPRFEKVIADQIARARKELQGHRAQRHLVAYVSTPISSRGGGHEPTNLAISAFVKNRLEARYSQAFFYAIDPGQFQLAAVDGLEPQGGDYLYMWTEILAGVDGRGPDFDLVYFVGPTDVAAFFGHDPRSVLGPIDGYMARQAEHDETFRKEVLANPERRQAFRRFYGLRASVAYSKGAHDEWNIFVRLNRKRGVGEQIAMHFDGRALSPVEMETEIAPGYEVR